MRLFRALFWIVSYLAVISLVPSALAQQVQDFETGLNPYRSYQAGNIDSINLFNRGLNVDIPLISYPQRGGNLSLDFDLHYINLGNWYDCNPGSNCTSFYGSGEYLDNGFFVILKNWPSTWGGTCQALGDQYGTYTCQASASMSDGSSHSMFPISLENWESHDSSKYQMDGLVWNGGQSTLAPLLIDANGTQYNQTYTPSYFPGPVGGEYIPTLVEDANGNEITYSQSTGWTDTMGRQIPLPVSASTSICPQTPLVPVSAYTWNLPGVNSGTYQLTFCYVNVPVTINWYTGIVHTSETELQNVLLPDSTSWTFQYTTDGNGDLSQITFPTGGTLSYTWTTEDPICNAYYYSNARAVVTRTLNPNDGVSPAGTWTYGHINYLTPVVTDPASNDTVHTFTSLITNLCPYYETETQYYQGSHTSGTLLKTVNTKFQSFSSYAAAIGQPSQTETLWAANSKENETTYAYDSALTFHDPYWVSPTQWATIGYGGTASSSYGLLETQKDYDYGNGAPGSLLRTTSTTYEALSNSNYLNNNMLGLPASVTVTGAGPGSTTTYAYDQTTPVSSGITTQHSSSPPGGKYRGNPTTVSRYLNTTGTYLNTTSTFFDTGMADVVKDPNSNPTTYGYSSTYAGALPTSVTNALNQTTTYGYDFNTGLETSTTDPNNQTTSYTYDDMLRTTGISYPDGGQTTFSYPTATEVKFTELIDNSGNERTSYMEVDGLGRKAREASTNGESTPYDEMDTCYDGNGRVSFTSYLYQDSGPFSATRCSKPGDSFAYDGLSRTKTTTHYDSSVISNSYSGNCTTVTDEAGKSRESCTDGLSRTNTVIENPGGLNYTTTYTYDALDNLTGVTQASSRQRTFVYDSLSRLTSSTNPESNTEPVTPYSSVATTYTYDGDGNVISKTEPAQNQQGTSTVSLSFCYDALNRMTAKAYTLQTCTNGTLPSPLVTYSYDSSSCGSLSPCLNIGHRTGMVDQAGSENWIYSYNQSSSHLGLMITDQRVTNSILKTAVYQYNHVSSLVSLQYPSNRTITYSYNIGDRPTSVVDGTTSVYYANTLHYLAGGAQCWAVFGGAATAATTFNPRLQPLKMQATSSVLSYASNCAGLGQTGNLLDLSLNLDYGSGDNGNVNGITNNRDNTRSQAFTYDALNRITMGETTSTYSTSPAHCWGESYQFDNQSSGGAWGTLTAITPLTGGYGGCVQESGLSVTENNQNRITTSGYGYDTAGNTTLVPPGTTLVYDAENHLTSAAGVTYTYDGDGERVEKSSGKIYWYGIDGSVLDETDLTGSITNSSFGEYVFLGGARIARRDSSNNVLYYFADQLGTTRVNAQVLSGQTTATLCYDADFYPFGGERAYTDTCTQNYKFTGKERDSESGLDNFEARYNSSVIGRFMSPDPENAGAEQINPQSWNMYSYVLNNPLSFTDPTGLDPCDDNNPTCTPGTGNGYGYTYIPPPDLFADPQNPPSQNPPLPDPCVPKNGCIFVQEKYHPPDPDPDACKTSDATCAHFLHQILHRLDLGWNQRFNPSVKVEQNVQECNSSWTGSTAGKFVGFGSLLSFVDDFGRTLKSWAEVIGTKGAYWKIMEIAGQSVTPAGETTYVKTVAKPIVGKVGTVGLVLATSADLSARAGCRIANDPRAMTAYTLNP
jgi:RHS repeat-associated protein